MTDEQRTIYEFGLVAGIERGYDQGWRAADESASLAHRDAVRVFRAVTKVEPYEVIQLRAQVRSLEFRLQHGPVQAVERVDLLPLHNAIKAENEQLWRRVTALEAQLNQGTRRPVRGAAA